MKLFYYDKFLESYSLLPKAIQKKVQDFIQKFRKDSTLHSIHLEPIYTFKDPQLRTARIDIRYRAIIHAPKTGDIYHLLWVDSHDEAMEWGKNKEIHWNRNTQSYQIYETVEPLIPEEKKEYKETYFLDRFSNEELIKIGVPEPLLPSVRKIIDLDGLDVLEPYLPRDTFENLFYLFDGIEISKIIEEIEEGKIETKNELEQINSANNKRTFFEVINDKDVEDFLNGDLRKWKIFLHPSQRTVVEKNYTGSFKLTGAAGTGKTVAAIHRLLFLSKNCANNSRILFTTFTKQLIRNLKNDIDSLGVEPTKYHIENIHSFIVNDAKSKFIISEDSKIYDFMAVESKNEIWSELLEKSLSKYEMEFLRKEYKHVIIYNNLKSLEEYLSTPRIGREQILSRVDRIEVWKIIELFNLIRKEHKIYYLDEITNKLYEHYKKEKEKPFDYIIADEIQDFSNVELRLLRVLVVENPNDLFLVGDPLQNIYHKRINFSQSDINIKGKKSRRLRVNYRTTEEIRKTAISVIKNESFENFDGEAEVKNGYVSILHGLRPNYELFQNSEAAKTRLFEVLNNCREESTEILNLRNICIATRTRNELREIKKLLHEGKYPYYDLGQTTEASGNINGIKLSTFHNIKGLEFKTVILYGVNSSTMPLKLPKLKYTTEFDYRLHEKSEKALLYVAMTRAIKELYIIGYGTKCEYLK